MQIFSTEIDYDKLIQKSLKNVVVEALKIAEEQGLSGDNHFYITFRTNHPGTKISAQLKSQYPEEMTIVLQHQYTNLTVERNHFSVDLSFGGILQTLHIPFDAIIYFADPHAKFGLSFSQLEDLRNMSADDETVNSSRKSNEKAAVISIDSFRKK